jgi:hypothetical protein
MNDESNSIKCDVTNSIARSGRYSKLDDIPNSSQNSEIVQFVSKQSATEKYIS